MDNVGVATQLCSVMTPTALHSCKFSPQQKTCYQALLCLPQSSVNQSEAELRGQWPIRSLRCNNNEKLLRFCTCCAIKCADNEFFLINLETVMNQYVLSLKIN